LVLPPRFLHRFLIGGLPFPFFLFFSWQFPRVLRSGARSSQIHRLLSVHSTSLLFPSSLFSKFLLAFVRTLFSRRPGDRRLNSSTSASSRVSQHRLAPAVPRFGLFFRLQPLFSLTEDSLTLPLKHPFSSSQYLLFFVPLSGVCEAKISPLCLNRIPGNVPRSAAQSP